MLLCFVGEGKEKEADSRDEIGDLDYLRKVKNIPHEFKGDKNTSNTYQVPGGSQKRQ